MSKGKTVFLRFDYKKSRWLTAAADKNKKLKDYLESEYLWMTVTNFPDNNDVWIFLLTHEDRELPIYLGSWSLTCDEEKNMNIEKEFFDAMPDYNKKYFADEIVQFFKENKKIKNYIDYLTNTKKLKEIDSKSPVIDVDYGKENKNISEKLKSFMTVLKRDFYEEEK